MALISRYSSNPAMPISRPLPDCLYPPNGISAEYQTPPLTLTVPASQPRRDPRCPLGVGAVDGAGQPVGRVVGDAHRVVVAVMRDHGEHGPEDLLAGHPRLIGQPGDHRGFDEETGGLVSRATTTARELAALGDRQIQVALYPVALARRDHRAADGAGLGRVAGLDRAHGARGDGDRLVVAGSRHHQPGGDRAALPGVQADREPGDRAGRGQVGVVEHQEGGLAPSSRNTFLMVAAASAITLRPVAVEPVNETKSTRGSLASMAPSAWSVEVTMLTTPGGMSVCSAISSPSTAATHGVSGAGLSTTVLPHGQRRA